MTTFFQTNAKICMIARLFASMILSYDYLPPFFGSNQFGLFHGQVNKPTVEDFKQVHDNINLLEIFNRCIDTICFFGIFEIKSNSAGCWWPSSSSSKLILPSRLMSKWSSIAWRSFKPGRSAGRSSRLMSKWRFFNQRSHKPGWILPKAWEPVEGSMRSREETSRKEINIGQGHS